MNTCTHFDVLKLIKNVIYKYQINQTKIHILINKNDNLDKFVYFGFSSWSDSPKMAATIFV